MNYDVIVAGAGPGGSTAARLLAAEGASVLLLDKQKFPRDKPCGGGVTLRAAAVLGLDLSPVVEQTVYGARFSLRMGPGFERRFDRPLTYLTQRCRLDAFLTERAIEAGADFHDDDQVREVDVDGLETVTVRTSAGAYSCTVLIGADGANGVIGTAMELRPDAEEAVAFEGNVPAPARLMDEWREYAAMDLGHTAGGYGWVFPKGDHLNVGVGAWKYAGFTLRPKLARLSRRYGLSPGDLESLRGHHLPVRKPRTAIARGPVALVGDAAGLVDPLSGEGIHMAFASGRLASESALAVLRGERSDMLSYQESVDRQLQPELDVSRQLQELFHFAPPPYVALMRRSDLFWRFFCHLIRGDLTYLDFMRMIGPVRYAVKAFAGAARRRREARVAVGERLIATGATS
jgi:geranylgeranyl reductase family protein